MCNVILEFSQEDFQCKVANGSIVKIDGKWYFYPKEENQGIVTLAEARELIKNNKDDHDHEHGHDYLSREKAKNQRLLALTSQQVMTFCLPQSSKSKLMPHRATVVSSPKTSAKHRVSRQQARSHPMPIKAKTGNPGLLMIVASQ